MEKMVERAGMVCQANGVLMEKMLHNIATQPYVFIGI